MHIYTSTQKVPGEIDKIWDFFSSPLNLTKITPPNLGLEINQVKTPGKMHEGMIISYKVRPMFGIPINWMSKIIHVRKNQFFVDDQLHGPYKVWHHEHHFKQIKGGVEMVDIVHYVAPFGYFGRLLNRLFIRNEIKKIFNYRKQKIETYFGKMS